MSINKSDIFNWKNVRRLRRLGVLLIIGFVCTFLLAFLSFHNVEKVFSVTGYSLSMADMVHAKPSLANYDYTHINFRGGKHLAELLYEALVYGKEQYDRRRAYEAEP